jgi:hypothetical protein
MNAFNPTSINMHLDKLNKEITNPLNEIIAEAKKKQDQWSKIGQNVKDSWKSIDKEKLMKESIDGLINGVSSIPEVGKTAQMINDVQSLVQGPVMDAVKAIQDVGDSWETIKNIKLPKKSGADAAAVMAGSPYFTGWTTTTPPKRG